MVNISNLPALEVRRPTGQIPTPPPVGSPTEEQIKRFAAAQEASRRRKEEEELRRYYAFNPSPTSPLNLAIAAQNRAAASPFIPTTPDEKAAYPLALQNQMSFPSPAAAYMLERQLEREQAARGLLDEMSPARATNFGLKTGNAVGDNNRERSFLERMAQSGLLSTLQGMARAERQYGVGPLAAFSESALDVQAARSAAQQKQIGMKLELEKERIKKSGPMEFKGPMIKTIEKASSTKQSLDAINRYLELLGNERIGGAGAKIEEGINAIGALFGAGGESGAATADSIRSQIITGLQMGVSQGQISQGDYEQLNKILSGSGWFVSNPKVEAQLQRLKGVLAGKLRTTTKILEAQGVDPSYFSPDAPSGLVSARRPAR